MTDQTLADAILNRLDKEGRLDCVVKGQNRNDGRPAPLCPEIISNPDLMCAGCAARTILQRGTR